MQRSAHLPLSGQERLASADAFRTIAELGGDLAFIIDHSSGLPAYVSPAVDAMLGYSIDEIRKQFGDGAGAVYPLCAGMAERVRRFEAGDGSRLRVVREFSLRRPDGRDVPVEVISTLLLDDDGNVDALAGIVRDLSERHARAQERKRFASMLNHEFRTPLSTIDGAIQRLEATNGAADEPTRQRHRKIATATDRLIAMLDDYLSPDRMAELGTQRRADTVSPRLLLEDLVAQARVAGRPVSFESDELPAALRADPAGLRLALKILLDNAICYSPEGTELRVAGRRRNGGIELALHDAGPGVPADEAARIFDRGYRGTNSAGIKGSGLGLYMARSLVEVHGGSLHLAPASGQGAEFCLWLPVQSETERFPQGLASKQS
jgi:two-component system OmpR family sensor kinase